MISDQKQKRVFRTATVGAGGMKKLGGIGTIASFAVLNNFGTFVTKSTKGSDETELFYDLDSTSRSYLAWLEGRGMKCINPLQWRFLFGFLDEERSSFRVFFENVVSPEIMLLGD